MTFENAYEDAVRACAYARLEFPGTYFLAYRDLPAIFREHVTGRRALDFGCGAGRSTRFLKARGFEAVGVDVSPDMLARARALDPGGDYRLVPEGDLSALDGRAFDLVLSAFTFDNVPGLDLKLTLFRQLGGLLAPAGRLVNLVSSPEIYVHEWASFSTAAYPKNRSATTGDVVRIVNTDIDDPRPVEDVLWPDPAYRDVFARAGLAPLRTYRPLGREDEPRAWVNETRIAPWVIYVLERLPEGR